MKTLTKSLVTTALVLAFAAPTLAAPAFADVSPNIERDVIKASGTRSNVRVNVNGDTVTLTGYVEDTYYLNRIERAARRNGAKKVNNYVLRSR